jgi:hypothetical protein
MAPVDTARQLSLSSFPIDSLAEYVLVAQDQHRVERFLRQDGNEWLLTTITGLESTVSLTSIQCTLALAEVYDKVEIG